RRPRHEDGPGFVGHDRGVEVKGRGAREKLARLLDREGIRVDLVRQWCRDPAVLIRADLPEPDGRLGGPRTRLDARVVKAPVTGVEAVRSWAGAGARLLRQRRQLHKGRDVAGPQEGGAGLERIVKLVDPDDTGAGVSGGQRGIGPLVEDNG